jgi:hypothetical protein
MTEGVKLTDFGLIMLSLLATINDLPTTINDQLSTNNHSFSLL